MSSLREGIHIVYRDWNKSPDRIRGLGCSQLTFSSLSRNLFFITPGRCRDFQPEIRATHARECWKLAERFFHRFPWTWIAKPEETRSKSLAMFTMSMKRTCCHRLGNADMNILMRSASLACVIRALPFMELYVHFATIRNDATTEFFTFTHIRHCLFTFSSLLWAYIPSHSISLPAD